LADGFLPEYYVRPQDFGLKLPNLQRLKEEGSWADGVRVQYPSLTLIAASMNDYKAIVLKSTFR
jgi:hypothetical protein